MPRWADTGAMTSLRIDSSLSTREAVVAKIPCPVIAAVARNFPEVEVTEAGIHRGQFIDALAKRGFSPLLLKLLGGALEKAAIASGKDGTHFDGDDLRKTAFFDGLTTGIFRNGFNQQRFDELMAIAKDGTWGAPEIARMVRALAKEQGAGLKAMLFTAFEYSAVRQTNVGSGGTLDRAFFERFYKEGVFTDRFHDGSFAKDTPRVVYTTAKTLVCMGAQAAIGAFTGNADLPALTPILGITPGASAALALASSEKPKGKCPFGHG